MGNAESFPAGPYDFTSDSACRIVVVAPTSGEECLAELSFLPKTARILAMGNSLEELQKEGQLHLEANVLLNVTGTSASLGPIIKELPYLTWIHSVTAGLDHMLCPAITENPDIVLTNAKGIYSSSLAEYVMAACSYFAKDFPRLMRQRKEKQWDRYCVGELRGKTMGIIGYGDIGRACAVLAKAYGMEVYGLRRTPELSAHDQYIDRIYGTDGLTEIISESDYLVVALALTPETTNFIRAEHLNEAKEGQILINIARGAVVNEDDLIVALENGRLAGAALDVFTVEPLPKTSKLWEQENVLLSPHNADMTVDFRHRSVRFFTENCARFIAGLPLRNIVSAQAGY